MNSRLALRIEVPGVRAARSGIPMLAEMLQHHHAGASFVFDFASDWLGRTVARHATANLHTLRDAGFETGVLGWNARQWLKCIEHADAAWSEEQFTRAAAAYAQAFSVVPHLHAAPGWRMNPHALRLTQRRQFAYASDTRGRHPFVPVWNGEIVRCPQIPTTLPTLDELARLGIAPQAQREKLLALTADVPPTGHVFHLRATARTAKQGEFIEALLTGWREQGYEVTSIQALAAGLIVDKLPRHEVVIGTVPGGIGNVLVQGEEFLSAWRNPT